MTPTVHSPHPHQVTPTTVHTRSFSLRPDTPISFAVVTVTSSLPLRRLFPRHHCSCSCSCSSFIIFVSRGDRKREIEGKRDRESDGRIEKSPRLFLFGGCGRSCCRCCGGRQLAAVAAVIVGFFPSLFFRYCCCSNVVAAAAADDDDDVVAAAAAAAVEAAKMPLRVIG